MPLACTVASFSPAARRLSGTGGQEQGRWAQWDVAWLIPWDWRSGTELRAPRSCGEGAGSTAHFKGEWAVNISPAPCRATRQQRSEPGTSARSRQGLGSNPPGSAPGCCPQGWPGKRSPSGSSPAPCTLTSHPGAVAAPRGTDRARPAVGGHRGARSPRSWELLCPEGQRCRLRRCSCPQIKWNSSVVWASRRLSLEALRSAAAP